MTILNPQRLVRLSNAPYLANSWYFVAAAAFAICNQPQEIPKIFHMALSKHHRLANAEQAIRLAAQIQELTNSGEIPDTLELAFPDLELISQDQQAVVARRIREGLLKGAALGGLPKIINALTFLKNSTPSKLRENTNLRDSAGLDSQQVEQRGSELWNNVYGKVSKRVKGQLETAYPDLLSYALQHVYGPLLSYDGVLSAKEGSLVIIACLVPQDVNPQLKGHLRGALNNGASRDEVDEARQMAIEISQWSGIIFKDKIVRL